MEAGMKRDIKKRLGDTELSLIQKMSKEDWKRIAKEQEYINVKEGSYTQKLILENDQLRQNKHIFMQNVSKHLWTIENYQFMINDKKRQILTGDITDEIKAGVKATAEELKLDIASMDMKIFTETRGIVSELFRLRGVVNMTDLAKNVIMTEDEYEKFCKETEEALERIGYKLFI